MTVEDGAYEALLCESCGHDREGDWPWQHHDGCSWLAWVQTQRGRLATLRPEDMVVRHVGS